MGLLGKALNTMTGGLTNAVGLTGGSSGGSSAPSGSGPAPDYSWLLPLYEQNREMYQQMLEHMKQNAKNAQDQASKQMVLQYAQRNLTREAYAAFERAMNAAMTITGARHAERERQAGGTGDIPVPVFHARESRDKAPEVGGTHWGYSFGSVNDMRELQSDIKRVIQWLEANDGNTANSLPNNMRETLNRIGLTDKDLSEISKEDLLKLLRDESSELDQTIKAFEAMDTESPDVDAFLDALGERANAFREDAQVYLDAHLHRKRLEKIKHELDKNDDGFIDPLEMPRLNDLSKEDIEYLEEHIPGLKGPNKMNLEEFNQALKAAITEAREAEQDAKDKLYDRSFDPVDPSDANPDDGNQWQENYGDPESSAMSAASAMLSEEDDIEAAEALLL